MRLHVTNGDATVPGLRGTGLVEPIMPWRDVLHEGPTRDGLALTERRILAAIAAGATTAVDAFLRSSAREARPFLGDTWSFARVDRLATAPTPLLETDPLRLTDAGREVLAGRADHVALNGIDRWIGGVHLSGREVAWRWDEGTETLSARRGR